MSYKFKLEKFEGPLNLLLDFIEREELSISQVSLARITDEYVNYVKGLTDFPKEEVADFLVVASTLMLIKSRSLLPQLEISKEEEESIMDLEIRLKLLKRIRKLSENITSLWEKRPMYARDSFLGQEFGFIEPKGVNIAALEGAFLNLVSAFPRPHKLTEKTLEKVLSIEEKMVELVGRISRELKSSFHKLVNSKNKLEMIVGFLALLELVKQGALLVRQEEAFGEINLEKAGEPSAN